jgi:hypothetical protein
MKVVTILSSLTLCLASSLVVADDRNCGDLADADARQECMKRRSNGDVDCSKIDDRQARRECAQRKEQKGADCSELSTPELRQECARRKAT